MTVSVPDLASYAGRKGNTAGTDKVPGVEWLESWVRIIRVSPAVALKDFTL